MEWIIDFFKSNPFSHLLLSYAIEKGFDTVGEIPKKIYNNAKQNTTLAEKLVDCLQSSLNDARDKLEWENENSAISETFIKTLTSFANSFTPNSLSSIFKEAVGHPVSQEDINCWIDCFLERLSSKECEQLREYIKLEQLLKSNKVDISKSISNINFKQPFRYNSNTTQLFGRENEMARLNKFIEQDEDILWWAVTGTGGSGKSRLAYDFAKKLEQSGWKACYYTRYMELTITALNHDFCNTRCNLLIVVDNDAYDFTQLAKWIFTMGETNYSRKIRILIIQRISSIVDQENGMPWIKNLLGHNEVVFDCFYSENDTKNLLELQPLSDEDLESIAVSFVKKMGYNTEEFGIDSQKLVVKKLHEIDPKSKRPLYLLFLTNEMVHKKDIRLYNQETIMNDTFKREQSRIRSQIEEAFLVNYPRNKLLYDEIELGIAIATVHDADNRKLSIESSCKYSTFSDEQFVSICEQFGLCQNGEFVPVEPDLLGEYYVMRYLHKFKNFLGLKSFWQRFFRDYYHLLNTTYKEGLMNIFAFAHINAFEYYYKGLYEAFFICDDFEEQKYIKKLLLDFSGICDNEEWKKAYKEIWGQSLQGISDDVIFSLAQQSYDMGFRPYVEEMLSYMDLVLTNKMFTGDMPKLHEYESTATAFGGYAKSIYAELKYNILANFESGERPYDETAILDCLNDLEQHYVKSARERVAYDLPYQRSEYPKYYALSMKECLLFFCGYPEINQEWLWGYITKIIRRLKEMYELEEDKAVVETYILTLMIQFEHNLCSADKKALIFNEILLLQEKHKNGSEYINELFSVFFDKYSGIVLL